LKISQFKCIKRSLSYQLTAWWAGGTLKTAKIKENGDNYNFAAVDITAICCKSVITMTQFLPRDAL